MTLCLAILKQYWHVTEKPTDTHRQTPDNSVYHASIASHGKN